MIFGKFASLFVHRSVPLANLIRARLLHEVHLDKTKNIFYVTLDEILNKKAVLYYKINGQVMDLKGVYVPKEFNKQGIARLLTETAFTYAIINDYYLFLTCSYIQRYYLAYQNNDLRKRIIGPQNVVKSSVILDPGDFDQEPDPETPITRNTKD